MEISEWSTKHIKFNRTERTEATKTVSSMLKDGWEFSSGRMIEKEVYGDESDFENNESVTLVKLIK